jgi:short-subunit dehydrogenase
LGLSLPKYLPQRKIIWYLVAGNEEKLKGLANELFAAHGGSGKVIPADLSKMEEVQKV